MTDKIHDMIDLGMHLGLLILIWAGVIGMVSGVMACVWMLVKISLNTCG